MATLFGFLKLNRNSEADRDLEGLTTSSTFILASEAPRPTRLENAPRPPEPAPALSEVSAPMTTAQLRKAQLLAMKLRQAHGALGARTRCLQYLEDAKTPDEVRFLDFVLRSIGGSG